ncbi:MAG: tetratricopeptide repeat protein [Alphaproteobacteria bacterium]
MPTLKQAIDLHRAGKLPEAERAYRAIVTASPREADAWSLLGVALEGQGKAGEAVAAIRRAVALDPKAPLFRFHLGNAFMASGDAEAAAKELQLAARMQPDLAEAHYNLGNALRAIGNNPAAIAAYRDCLRYMPTLHQARNNLALLISAAGDYDGAFAELQHVLAEDPGNIQARVNLANIADESGRRDMAYQEALKAVKLNPNYPDALFVFGLACIRLGRDKDAIAAYRRLVEIDTGNFAAWDNYAQCLQATGDYAGAEASYKKALAIKPDDPDVNYHIALLDLLLGRLDQGFAGYAWRFKAIKLLKRAAVPAPLWDGSDPAGKTILVADEQGFGDSIMFCRYLPLLRSRGAQVIYACRAPLQSLLQGWDGADRFVALGDAAKTVCDAHASMMDLPHLMGTGPDAMPGRIPYIPVPPGDVPPELAEEKNLRVGIVWAGNKDHKHDHRRSIEFSAFSAICGVEGVRYYNLLRPSDLRGEEAARFRQARYRRSWREDRRFRRYGAVHGGA